MKTAKLIPVTVIRSEWARGYSSLLYNPTTKQRCCMGFVCNAGGATDKSIANIGCIQDARDDLRTTFQERLLRLTLATTAGLVDQLWVEEAYQINDDATLSLLKTENMTLSPSSMKMALN